MMPKVYFIIVCLLAAYIFVHSRWFRSLVEYGRKIIGYKRKNKWTMFDVRHLLIKGEKDLAIRVYGELFNTNYQESRTAVEAIERSIQPKDFEI